MEAQTALVGADGAVELDTVAPVDLGLTGIVHPSDPELNGPLGLDHPLKKGCLLVFGMLFHNGFQGDENLFYGLQKLRFTGVLLSAFLKNSFDISVHVCSSCLKIILCC